MTAAYSLLISVIASSWANLWMCPPNNEAGPNMWWCGIDEGEKTCQLGNGGHFNTYPNGSILGFPPLTNSPPSATIVSSFLLTITTSFAGPSSKATSATIVSSFLLTTTSFAGPSSKATIAPASSPAKLPTAIGVAVGIPLGIIAIGFLVLLSWKIMRQHRSDSQILDQGIVSKKDDLPVPAASKTQLLELADTQLPRELDDTEIPSI